MVNPDQTPTTEEILAGKRHETCYDKHQRVKELARQLAVELTALEFNAERAIVSLRVENSVAAGLRGSKTVDIEDTCCALTEIIHSDLELIE